GFNHGLTIMSAGQGYNAKKPGSSPGFFNSSEPHGSSRFGGLLGLDAGMIGRALGGNVAIDKLDDCQRGVVAMAEAGLHDADIATIAVGVTRRDRRDQLTGKFGTANLA